MKILLKEHDNVAIDGIKINDTEIVSKEEACEMYLMSNDNLILVQRVANADDFDMREEMNVFFTANFNFCLTGKCDKETGKKRDRSNSFETENGGLNNLYKELQDEMQANNKELAPELKYLFDKCVAGKWQKWTEKCPYESETPFNKLCKLAMDNGFFVAGIYEWIADCPNAYYSISKASNGACSLDNEWHGITWMSPGDIKADCVNYDDFVNASKESAKKYASYINNDVYIMGYMQIDSQNMQEDIEINRSDIEWSHYLYGRNEVDFELKTAEEAEQRQNPNMPRP